MQGSLDDGWEELKQDLKQALTPSEDSSPQQQATQSAGAGLPVERHLPASQLQPQAGSDTLREGADHGSGSLGQGPGDAAIRAQQMQQPQAAGQHPLAQQRQKLAARQRPAVVKAGAGPRVVLRDGVHLFDPTAPHHWLLAREGAAAAGAGEGRFRLLGTKPGWWMWPSYNPEVVTNISLPIANGCSGQSRDAAALMAGDWASHGSLYTRQGDGCVE